LYTVAWSSAQAIGPLLGAQIVASQGYRVLWFWVGGVSMLLSVAYWFLQKQKAS
jgi:predicted MFS family arabinose efflux permease